MVSVLNDAARTLEDLRAELPSVADEAAAPLRKRRDATRDAQNSLWGQAKAPQVATRGRRSRRRTERRETGWQPSPPDESPRPVLVHLRVGGSEPMLRRASLSPDVALECVQVD